jgi:2-dehydro-3-deoxygluconokinase
VTGFVTIGETLAVIRATDIGPLRFTSALRLGLAGAESNVAIGVRRLGHPAAWIGRVGADELGTMIIERLRAEDINTEGVVTDQTARTALMLKERRTTEQIRVHYYREGSAGSRLSPDDIPENLIKHASHLHITGITMALSESAREAVRHAVGLARHNGLTVSLDVNYRTALSTQEQARQHLTPLLATIDVLFAGADELTLLTAEPAEQKAVLATGVAEVVIKRGSRGATVHTQKAVHTQKTVHAQETEPIQETGHAEGSIIHAPAVPVTAVDTVGAGDAFAAGYLAALLDNAPVPERLRLATLAGAFAVTVPDDWTGLPTRADLDLLAAGDTDPTLR